MQDMPYARDFAQTQRFDDPLVAQIVEATRPPGGKQISEKSCRAFAATVLKTTWHRPTSARRQGLVRVCL